ncbi:MAG: AraC-like DNA-binding protein [Oleiphilaceae bacterium]|jgi:AraC-like DNA-binding protein
MGPKKVNKTDISPKLYIWKNSRLYIGSCQLPFRKYTLAWSQLLVSIHGKIRIQLDDGTEIETRSCLIKAGSVVNEAHIDTSNAVIAIYYFNPISQDFLILESQMVNAWVGISYQHPTEDRLVQQLRHIFNKPLSLNQAYRICQETIVQTHLRQKIIKQFDARIIETLQNIRESLRDNLSISDYASDVHLSESRLNKLFKDQIGIPITKYRLQLRLSVGIILLAAGKTVTEAAYCAGFSSSAHFSTCFSDMIGIKPSTTFLRPPYMNAFISETVLKAIMPSEAFQL